LTPVIDCFEIHGEEMMQQRYGKIILLNSFLFCLYFSFRVFMDRSIASSLWANAMGELHESGPYWAKLPSDAVNFECSILASIQIISLYFFWKSKSHRWLILLAIGLIGFAYYINIFYVRPLEPLIFTGNYLAINDPVLTPISKQWSMWDHRQWLILLCVLSITLGCLILPSKNHREALA
jgi:hypothetical protein